MGVMSPVAGLARPVRFDIVSRPVVAGNSRAIVVRVSGSSVFRTVGWSVASAVVVVAHPVSRAEVHTIIRTAVVGATLVPRRTVITHVHRRASEVVIAAAVVVEHGIVPRRAYPPYGAEEVVQRGIKRVLPVEKHMSQVGVAVCPVMSVTVGPAPPPCRRFCRL